MYATTLLRTSGVRIVVATPRRLFVGVSGCSRILRTWTRTRRGCPHHNFLPYLSAQRHLSHASLRERHILVRLPSPCRSCNIKLQSRARHDLSTNSRLFSLGFNLALFSSECDSFCLFFVKFGLFLDVWCGLKIGAHNSEISKF